MAMNTKVNIKKRIGQVAIHRTTNYFLNSDYVRSEKKQPIS
jgi:hypothetical protein